MSRRVPLIVAVLCCIVWMQSVVAQPADVRLVKKYKLDFEVRKDGDPLKFKGGAFFDKNAGRLYYVGVTSKALAVTECAEPPAGKEAPTPQSVRRFALPIRTWDEKDFGKETKKIAVEVYRDTNSKRLVYVTESGAMAVAPLPLREGKPADPRWLYRLQLKVRPSGETDFIRNYIRVNVEVYLHEPAGHLIYVAQSGAIAVVETKKEFGKLEAKPPRWSIGFDLRARKYDQREFNPDTPRIGAEAYLDENAEVTIYATEKHALAAVPGIKELKKVAKAPVWKHAILAGSLAAEVYFQPEVEHAIIITPEGAIAVLREKAKEPAPAPPPEPGVSVCGLGVLSPSGKVLFVPGEKGVEAVALFNGKTLWETKDTGKPLLATADHVFTQLEVKGKKNQVKLVVLDATTGERIRDSDVMEFPEWVSVPRDYGRHFCSVVRLDKEDVLFIWDAFAFSDGGRPPPTPDPNEKNATGAFRVNLKTGGVTAVKDFKRKDEDYPPELSTQTKWNGWVFTVQTKNPEPGIPHALTKRTLTAEREDGTVSWKRPIAGKPYLPPRP